ncbi:MAG: HNH endonuclease [Fimbriimonas sp.]
MEHRLARVIAALPATADLPNLEVKDQARAALSFVFERMPVTVPLPEVPPDPATCPNCDRVATSTRSPYCGEACREEAGFVRQVRAGIAEGWLLDEEKQVALGQVLWHVLGGGRPFRQSIIPESSKKRALARSEGRCQGCGAPATTFDHSGSGCNRDINLRVVCATCSETFPFGDPRVLARAAGQIDRLAARIGPASAVRCCDDAESWDWRAYVAERKARVDA